MSFYCLAGSSAFVCAIAGGDSTPPSPLSHQAFSLPSSRQIVDLARQEDPNAQYILLVSGSLDQGGREFEAPVETNIIRLQFSIWAGSEVVVSIIGPTGREASLKAPNITKTEVAGRRVITIFDPRPGRWRLRFSGSGAFTAAATSQSDLYLCCLQFLGRVGFQGQTLNRTLPIETVRQMAQIMLSWQSSHTLAFQTITEDGRVIDAVKFRQSDYSNPYLFTLLIAPPPQPFRILARGTDVNGQAYQRVFPTLFQPRPGAQSGAVVNLQSAPEPEAGMAAGEQKILRAEVASLSEEPFLSDKGNLLGIRLKYAIRFPKEGVYAPLPQVFPERITTGYTGALSMRAIRTVVEPPPEGAVATSAVQYLGPAKYKGDLLYNFTVDLIPNYVTFNDQQRTFCIARKVFGQSSPARFEGEITSEDKIRFRIVITGTNYDGSKPIFTEHSYVPNVMYTGFLKEGMGDCG